VVARFGEVHGASGVYKVVVLYANGDTEHVGWFPSESAAEEWAAKNVVDKCKYVSLRTEVDPDFSARNIRSLSAAIEYAFVVRDRGEDGLVWLDDWRHGNLHALNELKEWRLNPSGAQVK
jgi:hypothetical protein